MTKQVLDDHGEANREARGLNPVPTRNVTRDVTSPSLSVTANVSPLRRVGDVANEVVVEWGAARIDTLAARIAANQAEQLEQLALTGNPPTRAVVETSLRLAARRILEEAMGA